MKPIEKEREEEAIAQGGIGDYNTKTIYETIGETPSLSVDVSDVITALQCLIARCTPKQSAFLRVFS